ncbi:MAG: PQQ-dependent sugar dehydrogenase, partial [Vicinamibacterales bacterium]
GQLHVQPFLDLSTRVFAPQAPDDERGALGIAFHPQYATNGQFFVYYVDPVQNIVVERFQVSGNPDVAFPNGTPVITITKPNNPFHNGGAIAFGPDGYLYIGVGDGACCNDPAGNGQNTNTLLGKVLRIDVDTPPYAIPASNPFVGHSARRGEIWAYGLRNPWRIDPDATGTLYIADVGESAFEEVSVSSTFQGGANFGWNVMEGPQCRIQPGCNTGGLTPPVISYSHAQGCSITGGFVYRGVQLPELVGHYFYSDYCTGFLRSFRLVNGVATQLRDWGIPSPGSVTSFGEDASGELYVLTRAGGVFRVVRQ